MEKSLLITEKYRGERTRNEAGRGEKELKLFLPFIHTFFLFKIFKVDIDDDNSVRTHKLCLFTPWLICITGKPAIRNKKTKRELYAFIDTKMSPV